MSLKPSDFIASSSQELLDLAKNTDLLDIVEHYELPKDKRSMLKHEIKNILIQFFVDMEIIMLTCPCDLYTLTPHFYIVKLGLTGVYVFSYFCSKT